MACPAPVSPTWKTLLAKAPSDGPARIDDGRCAPHHQREPSRVGRLGAASHAAIDVFAPRRPRQRCKLARRCGMRCRQVDEDLLLVRLTAAVRRFRREPSGSPSSWARRRSLRSGAPKASGARRVHGGRQARALHCVATQVPGRGEAAGPIEISGDAPAHLSEADHGDVAQTRSCRDYQSCRHLIATSWPAATTTVPARRSPSPGQRT